MSDSRMPEESAVAAAAAAIVAAFAATDGDRYFSLFAPEATFVFHTESDRLPDRASYERLWGEWVDSGWRVVSCVSSDAMIQTFPGAAVFTHTVDTTVDTAEGRESYRERESIVFVPSGDGLIAVHEHLSPAP
jgi:ketosteroid isomerase-like protein